MSNIDITDTNIWKPHPRYPHIFVSNTGLVYRDRSVFLTNNPTMKRKYLVKNGLVPLCDHREGYLYINITISPHIYMKYLVHRLVGETWLAESYSESAPYINHINMCKTDNRVSNLEWVSMQENNEHSYKTIMLRNGNRGCMNKERPVYMYDLSWEFIKKYESLTEAGKENGCNLSYLSNICLGRTKKVYRGYNWSYTFITGVNNV